MPPVDTQCPEEYSRTISSFFVSSNTRTVGNAVDSSSCEGVLTEKAGIDIRYLATRIDEDKFGKMIASEISRKNGM